MNAAAASPQLGEGRERSFGYSVGGVLCAIALYQLWRNRPVVAAVLGGLGATLVLLALIAPPLLRRPNALWWKFSHVLGYVNARVLMTVLSVVMLVPLGLIWRVIGRDPLGRNRRNWAGWTPYPARYRDRLHYRRMY